MLGEKLIVTFRVEAKIKAHLVVWLQVLHNFLANPYFCLNCFLLHAKLCVDVKIEARFYGVEIRWFFSPLLSWVSISSEGIKK
jgi:hypothetical protein